jgi:hypothetical protein
MKKTLSSEPFHAWNQIHRSGFTLVELLVILVMVGTLALLLVPASAHVRPGSEAAQCMNNLRQMSRAWKMYCDENNGRLVSAYPDFGGFSASWCDGNASTAGDPGAYHYSGADATGIQHGLLWPYADSLSLYKCPTDHRLAGTNSTVPAQFQGKPLLRSISMNSYLAGTSFGASPDWVITTPNGQRDPRFPVYITETEIKMPALTFTFIDEDQQSINDGMFLVSVSTPRLYDLPSRAHRYGFGISFADGRAEIQLLKDDASKTWVPGLNGGLNDWKNLTNQTTHAF